MAGGSVLQIGIAPLLIFGLFGFPDLGVAGAAWAYVASRIFSVALYLVILAAGADDQLVVDRPLRQILGSDPARWWTCHRQQPDVSPSPCW